MSLIVFTDLDDTLFSSPRNCVGDKSNVATLSIDGKSYSFFSKKQKAFIDNLNAMNIIPVTGRRSDSLKRVKIYFKSYKIVSHGALILDEKDKIIPEWDVSQNEFIKRGNWVEIMKYVHSLADEIAFRKNLNLRIRLIFDLRIPCYVCIKGSEEYILRFKDELKSCCSDMNLSIHINSRNMAILPPYASKRNAVRFLKEKLLLDSQSLCFIGIGDSISDLGFMSECDYQIFPTSSQIGRQYGSA